MKKKNPKIVEAIVAEYCDYYSFCGCKKCWPEMDLDLICIKEVMAEFEANRTKDDNKLKS